MSLAFSLLSEFLLFYSWCVLFFVVLNFLSGRVRCAVVTGTLAVDLPHSSIPYSRLFLFFLCLSLWPQNLYLLEDGESGRTLGLLLMISWGRKSGLVRRRQHTIIRWPDTRRVRVSYFSAREYYFHFNSDIDSKRI